MNFFDGPLVPGAESSKAWLDLVVKREGSVSGVVVAGDVEMDALSSDTSNEVVDPHSSAAPKDAIVNAFDITETVDGYMLNGVKIRKNLDVSVHVSVYDFIAAVTGQGTNNVGRTLATIEERHPEVTSTMRNFKFSGQGQRLTPIIDARGLVMIMNLLPGQQAAQFRLSEGASSLARMMGGADTRNEVPDPRSSATPKDTIVNAFEITEAVDCYMLNGVRVRRTGDMPPMISVYDFITAVTEQHPNHAGRSLLSISSNHPEVTPTLVDFKFPGRGQRLTPVTGARGLVMIMNLLPGQQAAQFRLKAADVMVRYLGGDQSLIAEIQRNAAAQDALPESNIGRIFGDAVASSKAIVPYDKDVALTPDDLTRPPTDERNNILPLAALAPNVVYIICLGMSPDGTHEVGMFGLTQDGKVRLGQHTVVFPHCKVTCVITCGRYNPAPIENALRVYFAANKVSVVGSRGVTSRECFGEVTGPAADALYSGAIDLVKKTMHEIVDSITYCNATEYFSPSGGRASDAALLEHKTLDLEMEREKTKQLQCQADADAVREKMLFEASPQLYMQYMTTRYVLGQEPKLNGNSK